MPEPTHRPLLSIPALTDTLSNFPLLSSQAGNSIGSEHTVGNEHQEETHEEDLSPEQDQGRSPTPDQTVNRRSRPRGRPPGRRRGSTTFQVEQQQDQSGHALDQREDHDVEVDP